MEGAAGSRYRCHICSQEVNPVVGVELNCPLCHGGFIEEVVDSATPARRADLVADHALTLLAPILIGMMGANSQNRRRRRTRQNFADADEDGEIEPNVRRRRRRRRESPATVLQLLQGISTDLENSEEQEQERERSIILINPFNQNPSGDFLMGAGLDILMQHLAENDSSRQPAQKEAVDALATVKVDGDDDVQCAICLDEFEPNAEAKEMPCKHRFHADCLLPWLEHHNSCPICRHQLPVDESRRESESGDSVRQTGTENPFGLLPWFLNALSASIPPRASSLSESPSPGSSPRGPRAASQVDANDVD